MAKTPTKIASLARAHTETAINVLAGIMSEKKAPHSARVQAAEALLSRGWGKPKQEVEHGVTDDLADLLREVDGLTRGLPGEMNGHTDSAEEPTIQ